MLDGDPAPPTERDTAVPTFRSMSTVAKWSPISATTELFFLVRKSRQTGQIASARLTNVRVLGPVRQMLGCGLTYLLLLPSSFTSRCLMMPFYRYPAKYCENVGNPVWPNSFEHSYNVSTCCEKNATVKQLFKIFSACCGLFVTKTQKFQGKVIESGTLACI